MHIKNPATIIILVRIAATFIFCQANLKHFRPLETLSHPALPTNEYTELITSSHS